MKMFSIEARFLVCLFLLLPANLAYPQVKNSATIDCSGATPGAFTSFSDAVLNSPDHAFFLVSGNCTDNVHIQQRNDLTFAANPIATIQAASPNLPVLNIVGSQNITFLSPFTLNGGTGISLFDSSSVLLSNITQLNSSIFGLNLTDSTARVSNSSFTANVRTGIVMSGGSLLLSGVNVSDNGRVGISAGAAAHLSMNDGNGPNIVSHNGIAGIQIFGTSHGDFAGDNEITSNNTTNAAGAFGLLVQSNSGLIMDGATVGNNVGIGIACDLHSQCQISDSQVNSNVGDGIDILEHSSATFGSTTVSQNSGAGVLVDQGSSLTTGGDTIANNTGDGLVLNTVSVLDFLRPDTITASAGNLALNCNNGSMVEGDVSTYKPKKCGAQFQNSPIH